jgi:hypothetical protein
MNLLRNAKVYAASAEENYIEKIKASARDGKLVLVVGAGVSTGLTDGAMPTWRGLIKNGFEYALKKGRIKEEQFAAWKHQYTSSDMDDLLSAAEFLTKKLGGAKDVLYARWLEEAIGALRPTEENLIFAIRQLAKHGMPICTLNYDVLLEDILGVQAISLAQTDKVAAWMRREEAGILHLHGIWSDPASCVLGIRDYASTIGDDIRDLFQRNLAVFNHLLFIGCGDTFSDPNFSALLEWLRTRFVALTPQHFALTTASDVPVRSADPTWSAFVEPVSYGAAYADLAPFLLTHFGAAPAIKRKRKAAATRDYSAVLDRYRSFLVRDCGQMTIEGVSADMDTGQRKFDLERLFVPLKVSLCPPDLKASDPDRSEKLAAWKRQNNASFSFGKVLSKGRSLALLALPGGGKTLLLKRIAVAYADPARRGSSNDSLPELELFPVLIRCREWRDQIRAPIRTLLSNIATITGQAELAGFSDAILPLLRKGKVLLLIDGLDEIHNDADRMVFVDHLEAFLDEYKNVRMIVTSREAGFNLVAPSLARFCERWRLAPLENEAITSLCIYWHRLMIGDTPAAIVEGQDVASAIVRNIALRRLAENPLLLTMLLVVKNGAGGLSPDRVTLYGRAVGVLLNTWNIRGHEPLNPREAVPQLSYVAFKMMQEGKQTATERELLILLEEARENLPHIRRYAKDSPHDFLKRVELRSSLLLEAGHQIEGGMTVPFYQFRHLTFQEYLAAVAITEGHYSQYQQLDTIMVPLQNVLLTEEWKEVIPMVAALAKKQAEPLITALVEQGRQLRMLVEHGDAMAIDEAWNLDQTKLPAVISRLVQCLVEEAEATPATLSAALELIAYFAKGCLSKDDWITLCQGPYGNDLYEQAWGIFANMNWQEEAWVMNTCASLAYRQKNEEFWSSSIGHAQIVQLLESTNLKDISTALLICMGRVWHAAEELDIKLFPIGHIAKHLFNEDPAVWGPATWTWTNIRRRNPKMLPASSKILDKLMQRWFAGDAEQLGDTVSYSLSCQLGMDRDAWVPSLTKNRQAIVMSRLQKAINSESDSKKHGERAAFFIAYHTRSCADSTLARKAVFIDDLDETVKSASPIAAIRAVLK